MLYDLQKSLRLTIASILICVVGYTSFVLVGAMMFAPELRQGSLVHDRSGNIIGSRLIAQRFTRAEYLWPRPSAVEYNASASAGSNLSPSNPKITARAEELLKALQPPEGKLTPSDLVLASGSGLDPHVTKEGALIQVDRIASGRNLYVSKIRDLIESESLANDGLVNVLELNLMLDSEFPVNSSVMQSLNALESQLQ